MSGDWAKSLRHARSIGFDAHTHECRRSIGKTGEVDVSGEKVSFVEGFEFRVHGQRTVAPSARVSSAGVITRREKGREASGGDEDVREVANEVEEPLTEGTEEVIGADVGVGMDKVPEKEREWALRGAGADFLGTFVTDSSPDVAVSVKMSSPRSKLVPT